MIVVFVKAYKKNHISFELCESLLAQIQQKCSKFEGLLTLDFGELVIHYCASFFCVKVTEVEWGIQVMMPQATWLGSSKRVKISVLHFSFAL